MEGDKLLSQGKVGYLGHEEISRINNICVNASSSRLLSQVRVRFRVRVE